MLSPSGGQGEAGYESFCYTCEGHKPASVIWEPELPLGLMRYPLKPPRRETEPSPLVHWSDPGKAGVGGGAGEGTRLLSMGAGVWQQEAEEGEFEKKIVERMLVKATALPSSSGQSPHRREARICPRDQ